MIKVERGMRKCIVTKDENGGYLVEILEWPMRYPTGDEEGADWDVLVRMTTDEFTANIQS